MPQDDAICRSSRRRRRSADKATVPHPLPSASSSLKEANDSLSPASTSAIGGEFPLKTHRCRRRRPSGSDRQVPTLALQQQSAIEYISCSNSSQAVSLSRSPVSGLELTQSAVNSSSLEEDDAEPDSLPDNIARATEVELKKQLIFADGKLKAIWVQTWPCAHRIPVHQRHRLQEPMRQHYGKLSQRVRLQKEFEARRMHREHNVLPLLPRRLQQEARNRLLRWYVPLNLKVTQHGIQTFCASQG